VNQAAGQPKVVYDAHYKGTAIYPMMSYDGLVTRAPNRRAGELDLDHRPRDFRRFVDNSAHPVQLLNGLRASAAMGKRIKWVGWTYASVPRIPGQHRDNWGGFVNHGIGPLEYQNMYQEGPGSQPVNPGGVRQIQGSHLDNPGTS
jgi:hypothetical protein